MSDYIKTITESNFDTEVLGSDRPVLVDFWAEWCAPCRMITSTIEVLAKEYEGVATVAKVNVDENQSIMQRYGIKGIPTLILFKDGKEAERIVGAAGKEIISRLIERHSAVAA